MGYSAPGARAKSPIIAAGEHVLGDRKGKGKAALASFARLQARPAAAATIGLHRGGLWLWLAGFETVRDQDVCRSRLGRPRCSRLSLDRRFFLFYILKKLKFQKYMSVLENFKNIHRSPYGRRQG